MSGRALGEALTEWGAYVRSEPCYMCRELPPTPDERQWFGPEIARLQAHHVLPQHKLKDLARKFHWDLRSVLTDSRNGMCLCEFHHARHTNHFVDVEGRSWRIPRRLIRDDTYAFAEELNIVWLLDLEYPPE